MSRRLPFFKFYPEAFMGGIRGLTPQDVGVYTMLLCKMYEDGGPVEYHVRRLSTYCNMREASFRKIAEKLIDLDKIQLEDGRLFNRRAETEISSRANDVENAKRAGEKSAEKRQQKQSPNSTGVQRNGNHKEGEREEDTSSLRSDVDAAYDCFVKAVEGTPIPNPRGLTGKRRTALKARLDEFSLEEWEVACGKLVVSDLCLGRKGGWKANLDFMLQPTSFVKLLEGVYDNGSPQPNGTGPPKRGHTPQDIAHAMHNPPQGFS